MWQGGQKTSYCRAKLFVVYNPTTYTSCESRKFSTASSLTIVKKTTTNNIQISIWLALQLVYTKVVAIAMAMFIAWAVVKARKISRAINTNLGNSDY